jgi:hypothetical protein
VALTDHASQSLDALDEPLLALHHKLLGHLSRAELQELIRLLARAREPLNAAEE